MLINKNNSHLNLKFFIHGLYNVISKNAILTVNKIK